nr:hypothetical protein CFP56_08843 [Quercus suber]
MSDNPDEDSAEVVVIIAWVIWHNRNEVRHGGRKKTGSKFFHSVKQYLQEFNEVNVSLPKLARTQVVAWAPSASRYKVVAAMSKKINAPLGPLEVEVKAWEEGGLSTPPSSVEPVIRGILMACGYCYKDKPFRFEEMWLAKKGCMDLVQSEWDKYRIDNNAAGVNFKARMLKSEVNDLMEKETRMWFQRSHSLWATFGDKNSKYFHSRATQRYRRNKIDGVRNGRGHWKHVPKEIANEFLKYFAKLFSYLQQLPTRVGLGYHSKFSDR